MSKPVNGNELGPNETQAVLDKQNNRCLLCDAYGNLHIDHNHSGRGPRVALCQHCMLMLGHSRSNPEVLRAGADYLTNLH